MNKHTPIFGVPSRLLAVGAGIACTFGLATQAQADPIAYEGFDYALETGGFPTDLLFDNLAGGTGWNGPWASTNDDNPTGMSLIQEGSLSYIDEQGNAVATSGNHVKVSGQTTEEGGLNVHVGRDIAAELDHSVGNVYYFSFIGQRVGPTVDMESELWDDPETEEVEVYPWGTNPYPRAAGVRMLPDAGEDDLHLLAGQSSGRDTSVWTLNGEGLEDMPSDVPFAEESFIVVRIEFIEDTGVDENDNPIDVVGTKVTFWVNPSDLTVEDATQALTMETDDDGNGVQLMLDGIGIEAGNEDLNADTGLIERPHAEVLVDEIRVGTTWADVTPLGEAPAPIDDALAFFELDEDAEGDFWLNAEGLGWVHAESYPWLYSYSELGWLYSYETSATFSEGSWFWDLNRNNWIHTNSTDYPWVYVHGTGWVDSSAEAGE